MSCNKLNASSRKLKTLDALKQQAQKQAQETKSRSKLPGGYLVRLTSLAASAIAGVIAVAGISWAKSSRA